MLRTKRQLYNRPATAAHAQPRQRYALPPHATITWPPTCCECTAGHSLGGAVAALCALRLLSTHAEAAAHVSCITFACVALGNQDVSRAVQSNGWSHLFHNFILPGALPNSGRTIATSLQEMTHQSTAYRRAAHG